VRAVCGALSKPFNFMAGIKGKSISVNEPAAVGVRRISLATSLYRAAMTGFLDAARQVRDTGQFAFLDRCVTTSELNQFMRKPAHAHLTARCTSAIVHTLDFHRSSTSVWLMAVRLRTGSAFRLSAIRKLDLLAIWRTFNDFISIGSF